MGRQSKYEWVIAELKRELREGVYKANDDFLTDKLAVERFNVSRNTIRRAFSQLEQEGFIERIQGRGTLVSSSIGRKTHIIGFLGNCLASNRIEPVLIKGIERTLMQRDSSLVVCCQENDPTRTYQYIKRLMRSGASGFILTPLLRAPEVNREIAQMLLEENVPFVLMLREIPGLEDQTYSVLADSYDGGRQITRHLLGLGHRRIAFFRSVDLNFCSALRDRRQGYLDSLRDAGIEPDPALEGDAQMGPMPFVLRRWLNLPDPPTAVFVDNDVTLDHFIEMAQAQGVRMPEDLSVAGFDDLKLISSNIPHTTIHVPHLELGQSAATQLLHLIEGQPVEPRHTRLPVSLVIRQTTGINPMFRRTEAMR